MGLDFFVNNAYTFVSIFLPPSKNKRKNPENCSLVYMNFKNSVTNQNVFKKKVSEWLRSL